MTIDETNLLHKKAETKKDGIYSFKGNLYIVKNFRFIAFMNPTGEFYQRFGSFNTKIGDLSNIERWNWKKEIKKWMQTQN